MNFGNRATNRPTLLTALNIRHKILLSLKLQSRTRWTIQVTGTSDPIKIWIRYIFAQSSQKIYTKNKLKQKGLINSISAI